ncbi:beta-ketoacyl synthase chain length factor [Niabella drilacis]|uniref:Beta-ketoacyl synthase, N-terminal domain n=1 Tax=Niabella drilacis (strain DSM 25811 / CCM 8410 / CCUG 62505 / LMG 26954 / E90) TaxID=1285928 RepID=A0A1G7BSF5_NIADE|nr:beta-ketoacyl synthase chain length factor [Niabella drilacis]SDE29913.1 Beta-ketoacyl synthase, N-terminal domain [Niabella drilacis]
MYIHQQFCISPQHTVEPVNLGELISSAAGKMVALEPLLEGVPPGMLRRMSKAVRMGIGAGLPLLKASTPDGIIIGTANGGMEDCIKFLNQIIDYEEGMLTPGNFVQSTPNAIAGQLSLITKNRNYNATHVHLGLAFENTLLDAKMFLNDHPGRVYLAGAVDEISTYNYNIDRLAGWYDPALTSEALFNTDHAATIAGEGAALFLLSGMPDGALARIEALETLHTTDPQYVENRFEQLLAIYPVTPNTLLLSGDNGDNRYRFFYDNLETLVPLTAVLRFKHMTGEYPTATSFATWLATYLLQKQDVPAVLLKKGTVPENIDRVIIYNQYHGKQHSFLVISKQ